MLRDRPQAWHTLVGGSYFTTSTTLVSVFWRFFFFLTVCSHRSFMGIGGIPDLRFNRLRFFLMVGSSGGCWSLPSSSSSTSAMMMMRDHGSWYDCYFLLDDPANEEITRGPLDVVPGNNNERWTVMADVMCTYLSIDWPQECSVGDPTMLVVGLPASANFNN
jgi:hypothetical protein